jgi:hypothetical protein
MCGSGRFRVPLGERGLVVDGGDSSEAKLAACRARVEAAGVSARLWRQPVESMELGEWFGAAFIPASSFCLLSEDAARAAMARVRAHLSAGARVLIEFECPREGGTAEVARTVTRGGRQIRVVSRSEYAAGVETIRNRYELKQSGRVVQTEDETLRLRCYTPAEMIALLEAAGFVGARVENPAFGWVAVGDCP